MSWVRAVQDEVLRSCPPADTGKQEQLLLAVQDQLLRDIQGKVDITVRALGDLDFEDDDKDYEEPAMADPFEWQESRFLRFLEAHKKAVEREREQKEAKHITHNGHDYVRLEAKELLKFFDENGLAANSLAETQTGPGSCPLRPQKTNQDYEEFVKDNFERVDSEDFQFSGFKFRGSNLEGTNFSQVEFTQFHDVYYNTGVSAERYDRECKDRKEQLVGAVRETASTCTQGEEPHRLRVARPPASPRAAKAPSRRSSPRKAAVDFTAPRRASPRKTARPASTSASPRKASRLASTSASPRKATQPGGPATAPGPSASGDGIRRRSGGEAAGADLTEVNRKKLRSCVYESLLRREIKEKTPIFRPCFSKLFSICKMYVIDAHNEE
jgi:hypothetical protein